MRRSWVWAILLVASAISFTSAPQHGFQFQCVNDACRASAATSLPGIIVSVALASFILFYRQMTAVVREGQTVKILRRIGAFLSDFTRVRLIAAPLTTLPLLAIEAAHTGAFAWSFDRAFTRDSDVVAIVGVFVMFVALAGYFFGHGKVERQTVGQYLLGYKVRPTETAQASFAQNTFFAIVGLCAWPVSIWLAARDPRKTFWWNRVSNLEAVAVTYPR